MRGKATVCVIVAILASAIVEAADPPGQFFTHDGVRLYYEIHGRREPLLLVAKVPAAVRETPQGRREFKVAQLLFDEPHIPLTALQAITAPTLILASDHDVIRDEHTVAIYRHITNAQLVVFTNATHMVPFDDPAVFNAAVDRFFRTPFVKKDRLTDMFKSLEKQRAAPQK